MEKGKGFLARYGYILIIAAVGALLLLIPSGRSGDDGAQQSVQPAQTQTQTLAAQEQQMEQILSRIEGVGTLHLMLTLASDGAVELAHDTVQKYSGDPKTPDDFEKQTKTVLTGSGGAESAVVTQRTAPVYKGALVVCTGGGDDAVRLAVTQALTVLTGLGSDCIAVVEGAA